MDDHPHSNLHLEGVVQVGLSVVWQREREREHDGVLRVSNVLAVQSAEAHCGALHVGLPL